METTIQEKAQSLKTFSKESPILGKIVCQNEMLLKTNEETIKERDSHNKSVLKWAASTFVIPISIIAIICTVIAISSGKWQPHHTLTLGLIAACFTTEIIIFFSIYKTHEVTSNLEMIDRLLDKKISSDNSEEQKIKLPFLKAMMSRVHKKDED